MWYLLIVMLYVVAMLWYLNRNSICYTLKVMSPQLLWCSLVFCPTLDKSPTYTPVARRDLASWTPGVSCYLSLCEDSNGIYRSVARKTFVEDLNLFPISGHLNHWESSCSAWDVPLWRVFWIWWNRKEINTAFVPFFKGRYSQYASIVSVCGRLLCKWCLCAAYLYSGHL